MNYDLTLEEEILSLLIEKAFWGFPPRRRHEFAKDVIATLTKNGFDIVKKVAK